MASLLERMNIPAGSSSGPTRNKPGSRSSSAPYNRNTRPPKRDTDAPWTHDMYESGSLSARLGVKTAAAPKVNLNTLTQKALQEANAANSSGLSIKGASTSANVVEVSGLVAGTTAEDVAAIFKQCGNITSSKLVPGGTETRVRLTFKAPSGANAAVKKFNNQPADGKVLSVRLVGSSSAGSSLGSRLGGTDGLGVVRDEGSVDVLMDNDSSGSKMRSDSLRNDPRAQVLVAPPGADPTEYAPSGGRGGRRGGGRGRGRRGRGRGVGLEARMDTS